ncbi:MAG: ribonuclease III [Bacteroidota bacterium]
MGFFKRLRKNSDPQDQVLQEALKNIIGFYPGNIFFYKTALRHKSAASDDSQRIRLSNERMEYLGDAVLSTVVADYLYRKFPSRDEGFLTEMRSRLVSRNSLGKLSEKMGVSHLIEARSDLLVSSGNFIAGNAFEALIGAIFLDKGYEFTKDVIVNRIIKFHIDIEEIENNDTNFKSRLIEWAQREKKNVEFILISEEPHNKGRLYTVNVLIDGEAVGKGAEYSKKAAEQSAAGDACIKLNVHQKNSGDEETRS